MPGRRRLSIRRLYKTPLAALLLAALAACGYQLRDRGLSAPEGVESIAVPVFENRTAETGLEAVFSKNLAYEFTRSKVLRLVDKEGADAVLTGIIVSMRDQTISYTSDFDSAERRVRIVLDVSFMRKDGKVLWADAALSDVEAYKVAQSKEPTEKSRRKAIEIISERLAERIHNGILENF